MLTPVSNSLRKHHANVYTVMLALSVAFLLIAVIAMIVEIRRYAPEYSNTSAARPTGVFGQTVDQVAQQWDRLA